MRSEELRNLIRCSIGIADRVHPTAGRAGELNKLCLNPLLTARAGAAGERIRANTCFGVV